MSGSLVAFPQRRGGYGLQLESGRWPKGALPVWHVCSGGTKTIQSRLVMLSTLRLGSPRIQRTFLIAKAFHFDLLGTLETHQSSVERSPHNRRSAGRAYLPIPATPNHRVRGISMRWGRSRTYAMTIVPSGARYCMSCLQIQSRLWTTKGRDQETTVQPTMLPVSRSALL